LHKEGGKKKGNLPNPSNGWGTNKKKEVFFITLGKEGGEKTFRFSREKKEGKTGRGKYPF